MMGRRMLGTVCGLAVATGATIALFALAWESESPSPSDLSPSPSERMGDSGPTVHQVDPSDSGIVPRPGLGITQETLFSEIVATQDRLIRGGSTARRHEVIAGLLRSLHDTPDSDTVVAAMVAYLDSGADADTGFRFAVGADGFLSGAPTLRCMVLDQLGRIDRAAAAEYAQTIFKESQVPDEWALALRDWGQHLGRDGVRDEPSFQRRVVEFLNRASWRGAPSAGYLHGYDAAAYAGGERVARELIRLHAGGHGRAVEHASSIAVNRLAFERFTEVAGALASELDAPVSPLLRAQLMARADPRDGGELAMLEAYLADISIGEEERSVFLSAFPNVNLEISPSLLTGEPPFHLVDVASRDSAALRLLETWRGHGELPLNQADLDAAIDRVEADVASYRNSIIP